MKPAPTPTDKAESISDAQFSRLASFANREYGIKLSPAKKPLVYSRLCKRLQELKIPDIDAYLDIVETNSKDGEVKKLASALTTNVTSFFREPHHFESLEKALKERFSATRAKNNRLRIWSAGCSTGEEAYSIAITVERATRHNLDMDAKILATDIDANVIEVARAGRYKRDALGPLGSKLERDYFAIDPETDTLQIRDTIKKKVSFGELNLVSEIPVRGPFDAIFCRNVAIYFETETQQKLWNVFANLLSPDGLLFIGHSERVTGPALKKLKICGVTTYRRSDS